MNDKNILTSYLTYDEQFHKFIDDFYETNLIHLHYLEVIDQHLDNTENIEELISTADLEILCAILTSFVRQERFITGLWKRALERKIF